MPEGVGGFVAPQPVSTKAVKAPVKIEWRSCFDCMIHSSLLLFFKISSAIRSFSRLCASFTCSEDPEL